MDLYSTQMIQSEGKYVLPVDIATWPQAQVDKRSQVDPFLPSTISNPEILLGYSREKNGCQWQQPFTKFGTNRKPCMVCPLVDDFAVNTCVETPLVENLQLLPNIQLDIQPPWMSFPIDQSLACLVGGMSFHYWSMTFNSYVINQYGW